MKKDMTEAEWKEWENQNVLDSKLFRVVEAAMNRYLERHPDTPTSDGAFAMTWLGARLFVKYTDLKEKEWTNFYRGAKREWQEEAKVEQELLK